MNLTGLWDQLVDCICRPPRDEYAREKLIGGRSGSFRLGQTDGRRDDITLTNKQGLKIECSHYTPKATPSKPGPWPCVVYCHCNSGSRKDADEALILLLPHGISVFCMDFAGSGLSEGQWVTLGAFEADDLEVIIQHLRQQPNTSTIGLWGRSMGAVTCLLYSRRDPSIAGMVLDSPFSKLTDLMMELVSEQKLRIPKPFMKIAVGAMRRSVKKRAKFDINDVSPLDVVGESFIPALFGHADGDTFIKFHHSELLFGAYAGDKNFIKFGGDHNTRRPEMFYTSVYIFFHNTLCASLAAGSAQLTQEDLYEQACRNLTLHNQQPRHERQDASSPWSQPSEGLLGAMPKPHDLLANGSTHSDSGSSMSDVFQDHLLTQLLQMANEGHDPEMLNVPLSEEEQLERAIRLSMLESCDASARDSDAQSSGSSSSTTALTSGPTSSSPPHHHLPPPELSSSPRSLFEDEDAMVQEAIRLSLQDFSGPFAQPSPDKPGQADVSTSASREAAQHTPVKREGVFLLEDVLPDRSPVIMPPRTPVDSLRAEAEMEALQNSVASSLSRKR